MVHQSSCLSGRDRCAGREARCWLRAVRHLGVLLLLIALTVALPLPVGAQAALPATVSQTGATVSTTLPVTAACPACHNSLAAKGHATLMTTATQVETCVVCHGTTSEFAVAKVHQ